MAASTILDLTLGNSVIFALDTMPIAAFATKRGQARGDVLLLNPQQAPVIKEVPLDEINLQLQLKPNAFSLREVR